MEDVQMPPAWVTDLLGWPTGRGVRVGIIGSGFDRTLRDQRLLPGVGFVDPRDDLALLESEDDHDRLGSGTACADLVLRIAPEARVVPIRVLGGGFETSPGTFVSALRWAVEQKLDVVSVGVGTRMEETLHSLYAACERGRQSGTVFVAAGHLDGGWSYPGNFENVIGVASGRFPSPYQFRYHPDAGDECEAWGAEVPARWLGGERRVVNGTMFAAANMAGIVALLRERYPGAPLERIRDLLQRIARNLAR